MGLRESAEDTYYTSVDKYGATKVKGGIAVALIIIIGIILFLALGGLPNGGSGPTNEGNATLIFKDLTGNPGENLEAVIEINGLEQKLKADGKGQIKLNVKEGDIISLRS